MSSVYRGVEFVEGNKSDTANVILTVQVFNQFMDQSPAQRIISRANQTPAQLASIRANTIREISQAEQGINCWSRIILVKQAVLLGIVSVATATTAIYFLDHKVETVEKWKNNAAMLNTLAVGIMECMNYIRRDVQICGTWNCCNGCYEDTPRVQRARTNIFLAIATIVNGAYNTNPLIKWPLIISGISLLRTIVPDSINSPSAKIGSFFRRCFCLGQG